MNLRFVPIPHKFKAWFNLLPKPGEGMPHRIQVFSGGCRLCEQATAVVEVGKCKDCTMDVLNIDDPKTRPLTEQYSIDAVPSIVIDGKIKVVGVPTFPWFCGDEFYGMLQRKYPLK